MLAAEMLLNKQRIHRQVRVDRIGYGCHLGHLLHDDSVVDRIMRILSPGKGTMILYQYARCMYRIQYLRSVLQLRYPVSRSYSPFTSASVMSAVQGMASWK